MLLSWKNCGLVLLFYYSEGTVHISTEFQHFCSNLHIFLGHTVAHLEWPLMVDPVTIFTEEEEEDFSSGPHPSSELEASIIFSSNYTSLR